MGEEAETEVWLDMSVDLKYISKELYTNLINEYSEIGKMLNSMINSPGKFCY